MNPDNRIPGFSSPAAGFEAPLEMLAACHGRIEQQCATLGRLVPHVASHGSDAQAQSAAAAVMRYFDTSALKHHADEERDLFPALREAMAGSDAVCIREMAERVGNEHRELEAAWQRLRAPLARIAAGEAQALSGEDVEAFVSAYAAHLAYEEAEVLPMAERLLDVSQLDEIGRAMRERRGIDKV
ncbi:MAG TPA: hemerythrin domain-containing protein [Burkholderiales bacterium]|jgi:hemerythrin-like domain-containing protein